MVDLGHRAPLLDFFRREDVARDVRLLAAQGAPSVRPHERLGLLMLLVSDRDPDVASAAESTIEAMPRESIAASLARVDASTELRAFFSKRGIEPADVLAPDADGPALEPVAEPDSPPAGDDEPRQVSTIQKIASLNVAQRIELAMKGTREDRAILIPDPNKIVGVAALSSPKLTEAEVEDIAKMTTISDELLRTIANTPAWVKNYGVVVALVRNPKTPLAVSMNLLARLQERDVRLVAQDRNIPDPLRLTARRRAVVDK